MSRNCGPSPVAGAMMTHVEAQQAFADLIKKLGLTTVCYWWKLLGDDANSLSQFIDVSDEEMRLILRKCRILYGPADSLRTSEFEKLMTKIGCHYTTYRPSKRPEYFLKIGDRIDDVDALEKPKAAYSVGGVLENIPLLGVHLPGVRTKISRRLVARLIEAAAEKPPPTEMQEPINAEDNTNNKGSMTIYINDLIEAVKKEIMYASRQGDQCNFTQRAERMIRKAAVIAIKSSVQDLFDAWVEGVDNLEENGKEAGAALVVSTPAITNTRRNALAGTDDVSRRLVFGGDVNGETPTSDGARVPLITPPVDLTEEVDERDVDVVLTKLKEQTILQNLLHKRLENNQRVLVLEHKNGRKLRVFVPPDSQSAKAFLDDAKKTRWINDMLCTEAQREGMMVYLAKTQPDEYIKVANSRKLRVFSEVLNTPQTIALGRLTGINDKQMAKLRSYLSHVGNAELKLVKKEVNRIDKDVGNVAEAAAAATFDTCNLEWSTTNRKGVEKKLPEQCSFWNAELLLEVAAEIDLLFHAMLAEKVEVNMTAVPYPSLDYVPSGFQLPGIIVLFGGDHGAGACPCSMKLNFSSPEERKRRGQLNWRCPTIQIASIDCTKDTFELLANTIMPRIKSQLINLRNCAAFVLCSTRQPYKHKKAFLSPKTLDASTINVQNGVLAYNVFGQQRTIDLAAHFDTDADDFSYQHLVLVKVISNFHDLHVGDLAFLCMAIGMNHSDGAHCIHCKKKARQFNCNEIQPEDIRTKQSLTTSLNEFNFQRMTNRRVRNFQGVNTIGLLDVDPQRVIVPVLHCPMGLVDKVLESFKAWTICEAEQLPSPARELREAYKQAIVIHRLALETEAQAKMLAEQAGRTPELLAQHNDAKKANKDAAREEKKAKDNYDEMTKRHWARLCSLSQTFDSIFRANGIKKEHYHGGKYNGVNCIRIMEKAETLFNEFGHAIKQKKEPTVSDDTVDLKCAQFARLMGLLDAIWSSVRGIDAGLLPTDTQVQHLRRATSEGKSLWLEMGLTTLQPKWHLTFDGHLLHQVITYGGIADKADDTIEFQHQILMKLRDRYRSIASYQRREGCIRRELRRRKSPEIQSHIDSYESAIKLKNNNKRQQDAADRHTQEREAKRIKREAVIDG